MPPPPLPSVSLLIFLLLWQPGCRGLTVAPPHLPGTGFAASGSICTVGNTLSPALQMAGKQVCGSTSAGRLVGHAGDSNSTPVLKGLPLLLRFSVSSRCSVTATPHSLSWYLTTVHPASSRAAPTTRRFVFTSRLCFLVGLGLLLPQRCSLTVAPLTMLRHGIALPPCSVGG